MARTRPTTNHRTLRSTKRSAALITPPPSETSSAASPPPEATSTTSNRRISRPRHCARNTPTVRWHSNSQIVSDQKVQTTYSKRDPRINGYRKMVTKTVTMTVTTTIATTEIVDGEEVKVKVEEEEEDVEMVGPGGEREVHEAFHRKHHREAEPARL